MNTIRKSFTPPNKPEPKKAIHFFSKSELAIFQNSYKGGFLAPINGEVTGILVKSSGQASLKISIDDLIVIDQEILEKTQPIRIRRPIKSGQVINIYLESIEELSEVYYSILYRGSL